MSCSCSSALRLATSAMRRALADLATSPLALTTARRASSAALAASSACAFLAAAIDRHVRGLAAAASAAAAPKCMAIGSGVIEEVSAGVATSETMGPGLNNAGCANEMGRMSSRTTTTRRPSLVLSNRRSAKPIGQPDAAVRGRIARQLAGMQRNARPGDALHEGHRCIVIKIGVVLSILLENAVDAGRCLVAALPGRHGRAQDFALSIVDGDALLAQRHDGHDGWAARTGKVIGVSCLAASRRCWRAQAHGQQRQQRHVRKDDPYSCDVVLHLALPIELVNRVPHHAAPIP